MGKETNHYAVSIICGILTIFGIAVSIISIVSGNKDIFIINDAANPVVSVLIGYYAFIGYRKPHGNLLKYIILIFTLTQFFAVYRQTLLSLPWQTIISAIVIGLCCYVVGRLHRVKQNIVLMSIVTALIVIRTAAGFVIGHATIGAVAPLIIWVDIFVAYVLRYKEHKDAGLTDAEK